MEDGGLEHRVDQSLVLLAALQKPFGIFDVAPEGRNRGGHVLAVLHAEDGVLGVGRSVGGAEDGLDRIVLDHLFQRRVRLFAFRLSGHVGTAVREQIADRDQFDVGMILEVERQTELADAVADDPDPDLAVAEGLPLLRSVVVGFCLVKAGNALGRLSAIDQGTSGGSSRSGRGQERSAGYLRDMSGHSFSQDSQRTLEHGHGRFSHSEMETIAFIQRV